MGGRGLAPPPRLVDWSLLAALAAALVTGVVGLWTGHPDGWPVVWLHGLAGVLVVPLLAWKLRRVRGRVTDLGRWDRTTPVSVAAAVAALAAVASGVWWVHGGVDWVAYWTVLSVHILFGLVVVPLVAVHLAARFRPPRRTDFEGRRTALTYAGLVVAGTALLRVQGALNRLLDSPGAARRFTGSKPVGGSFPVTSWVADDPEPVDPEAWRLRVEGRVDEPLALAYEEMEPDADRRALLDCTSGWYTVQDWQGVRIGDLLDRTGVGADAGWVTVRSVTGYRWSIPLAEARDALLATHVGGDRLDHGHGFPARLVVPDRRGFQWVKWVESVEVRRRPDPGQWLAIFASGFAEV